MKADDGYSFFLLGRNRRVVIMDGDKCKFKRSDTRMGGSGFGMATEDVCYTVTVADRHMVGVFPFGRGGVSK